MIGKSRGFVFVVAVAAALVMLLGLSIVALASGDTPATVTETACVDGYVINHREVPVDGTKTVPPLVVEAVGAGGYFTATVGADGYFKFEKLPVGDWVFQLKLPPNWEGIVPLSVSETDPNTQVAVKIAKTELTKIAKKDGCQRIVFKIRRTFTVPVVKWEELLSGAVQGGADWVITATPVDDPFVKAQTETTAADGRAWFTLTPGQWVISEVVKSGWKPLTPQKVTIVLDQYDANVGARADVVFKNLQPPCYGEIVVTKTGFAANYDPANPPAGTLGPLAGWKVTVSRADGAMAPVSKLTDGAGLAKFTKLAPGVYKVAETVQGGWEALDDNPQTVIIEGCESEPVKFDNRETLGELKISGKKLFKAWTAPYKGELVGLSGWVITATLVGTDMYTTTLTDALGGYLFSEAKLLTAGMAFPGASIDVCEEDRTNWIHVTPKCMRVTFPYPVPADYPGALVNFTNIQDPPLAAAPSAVSNGCRASHSIALGETLARIATRYGTSVTALVRANNIRNADVIYAGQKLCIP